MREKGKITRGDVLLSSALAAVIVLTAALPYRINIPDLSPGSWKLSTLSVILSFFLLANVCRIFFIRRRAGAFLRIFLILLGLLAFLRMFQVTASVQSKTVTKPVTAYDSRSLPMAAEGSGRAENTRTGSEGTKETQAAHGPYSVTSHTQGK